MSARITKATTALPVRLVTIQPLASIQDGRADKRDMANWTERERIIRTCMHCKTPYKDGGRAYRCELNHEGLLGI